MVNAGPQDLKSFFTRIAYYGETQGRLHIEKTANPQEQHTGFATLSGELGILNAEPARGVVDRNGIGWFFFNMPSTTTQQFHDEIGDLITYLTGEGLTVESNTLGEIMADIVVSWA